MPWKFDTHEEDSDLLKRLCNILEISVPVLYKKQDIQNKANSERSTKFSELEELVSGIFILTHINLTHLH